MPPLPLKPPVRARRIRPLHVRERTALTAQAIEELFRSAEVLAEGGLDGDPGGRWYGSIMITFDLTRLARRCRGLEDPARMATVVEAVQRSVRVRIRAHRMACAEIYRRFPDRAVGTAQLESAFRRDGDRLLMDIDLEAPIDLPSRRSAT
ncbi:MAG TPA: hypothetical protein RMH99_31445 [Sandaracinaceae bacterium LLY-WYZ-13_1]|nr:hypothetical protein [Sandaracinaceae bacterium LLY-WYZ-13_1]